MDKTAIRNFAIWARKQLIEDTKRMCMEKGITEKEILSPLSSSTSDMQFFDIGTGKEVRITKDEIPLRDDLIKKIQEKAEETDYASAFAYIVEKVAYTWFNRIIAIRFMEVNDYLPSEIRVLSSIQEGKNEPDLVSDPFESSLEFTEDERKLIYKLKEENAADELFRMLFIKQCKSLQKNLPELFDKNDAYMEMLLSISYKDINGIVYKLVHGVADGGIDEEDFNIEKSGQVEIIGWLYQYYNEERRNEVININKGTVKKDDIPAATQLFTTDWVVRYMVDNSLGRYWMERNPKSRLKEKLTYLVIPKSGELSCVDEKILSTDVTFLDPCMGSGHILVYAFDVLMEIYRENGYSDRDAAISIVENNLYGLDIDDRAYQLAYFAVMMKARQYNRRVLTREEGVSHNLCAMQESNGMESLDIAGLTLEKDVKELADYLRHTFQNAKEIGSLIFVEDYDYKLFADSIMKSDVSGQLDLLGTEWYAATRERYIKFAKQAMVLSKKYNVVATNPPYLGKMKGQLKKFVTDNYKDYSGDLFSVFMYRNFDFCKKDGYSAFMTPFVWMFIKKYARLRDNILQEKSIVSLIQLEYSAFEEATVPICTFILKNNCREQSGVYIKLSDFKGGMNVQKEKVLEALSGKCDYIYYVDKDDFFSLPEKIIAFWVNKVMLDIFANEKTISDFGEPRVGLQTGENEKFVRLWTEIGYDNFEKNVTTHDESLKSNKKWYPYNKGGDYRKWYGNNDYVVDWLHDGKNIREDKLYKLSIGKCLPSNSKPKNEQYYFKSSITWSTISSGNIAFRYKPKGHVFDIAGASIFVNEVYRYYLLGFCNSDVATYIAKMISPTINFQAGDIAQFPVKMDKTYKEKVEKMAKCNLAISQEDWDSFETSWDFKRHPLLGTENRMYLSWENDGTVYSHDELKNVPFKHYLKLAYESWENECANRFEHLKANEEELNQIFIDIYGLQDELTPEVADKDITVRKADLQRDIKSFISYAVGCMFGRYSPYKDGLQYAGGEWDLEQFGENEFLPDEDNIIPITDDDYFDDDIVGLFCKFLSCTFGEDTLEDNLKFVADALGNKGDSSREVIRNYFLKDFFKDHCKIYQKRPIYWLFDSGKQNGFKALIYMHRYNADSIGNLRVDYLHRMERIYENEMNRMQETIATSDNARDISQAEKRKEKMMKQLKEAKEYDQKIGHLALARIEIDLDDGVRVNYEKIQTDAEGQKLQVLAKI